MEKTPRPDINPYRFATSLVLQRLAWDLKLESWRSRKALKSLKNSHAGEKAVVVCNGPSLLNSDLSLLENIFTFGLNKINLLFESNPFRPSCVVAVNSFVIDQNRDFFNTTDIPLFINNTAIDRTPPRGNIVFLHTAEQKKFAADCSISVYVGNTVTYVALQLAFHFGFSEVALIGCDHAFSTTDVPNKTLVVQDKDKDHFHPDYFPRGAQWQFPDILQSEVAYSLAKQAFDRNGRTLYNATEGGKLALFPRKPLADFIAS